MTTENRQLPQTVEQKRGQLMSPEDLINMQNIAKVFVDAGMFEVTDKEAERGMTPEKKQAIATVQIMAGQEMGLTPFAAMKGMHIIKGKASPSYQTLGALVKRTPGYDYKVLQRDRQAARIEFFRNGESLGVSEFGTKEMQAAKLGGDMYTKYMENMFFARAMTNGVNSLCPEVTMGPVYTPADFGGVEDDNGNLIMIEDEPKKSDEKQARNRKSTTPAQTQQAQNTPVVTPAPTTQNTGTKSTLQTPAQTANTSTGTSQAAGGNEQATSQQEEVEAEVIDDKLDPEPDLGPEVLAQMLEAGVQNGWTEEQAEAWILQFLSDNGVNTDVGDDQDALLAQITMKHVDGAVNYLLSNKPQ